MLEVAMASTVVWLAIGVCVALFGRPRLRGHGLAWRLRHHGRRPERDRRA